MSANLREQIENAIDAYRKALRVDTEAELPQAWATTNNNLGSAYSNLAPFSAIHLRQIEHDLKVLSPGRRYADQAIEAIRAMVGLDSQKLQMERQEQENNREKRLRKDLAIVGSGLAVSSIAASTRSRPTEKFLTHRVPHYAKSTYKLWPEILWLADIGILAFLGLLWELWYKFQVSDNISITPAIYSLSRPYGQFTQPGRSNDLFGGLI